MGNEPEGAVVSAKPQHFVKARWRLWRPELRRAMIAVRPEYFSWSQEQQDYYGVNISEEDHTRLKRALRKQVGARAFLVEHDQLLLPLVGIGEDYFRLDESPSEGWTVLESGTLRKFDELQFEAHEEILR